MGIRDAALYLAIYLLLMGLATMLVWLAVLAAAGGVLLRSQVFLLCWFICFFAHFVFVWFVVEKCRAAGRPAARSFLGGLLLAIRRALGAAVSAAALCVLVRFEVTHFWLVFLFFAHIVFFQFCFGLLVV